MSKRFDPPSTSDKGEPLRVYLRRFISLLNTAFDEHAKLHEKNSEEREALKTADKKAEEQITRLHSEVKALRGRCTELENRCTKIEADIADIRLKLNRL